MSRSKQAPLFAVVLVGGAVIAGLVSPGCSPKPRADKPVSDAGVHAVHSDRLAALMDSLDKPTDNLPKELDVEGDRQQKIARVSATASELADSAARIPEVLEGVELSQRQREDFIGLAEQLEKQARELEVHARKGDFAQAARVTEQLNETCDFCHRRFRVLPLVTSE